MPVVGTSPYPSAEELLQATRVKVNDAALSIDGNVLADDQPYVFPMLEERYEYLQDRLVAAGVNTFNRYIELSNLTAVARRDPTIQVTLDYVGYFDGLNNTDQPQLPPDMIQPLELWERETILLPAVNPNAWLPMTQAADSISTRAQSIRFGIWDWEYDTLYLPGSTQANDIKIKYIAYAPQLTGPDSQVLVARSKPAMAALMAEAIALARGGVQAAEAFHAEAEQAIQMIISRSARKEEYASFFRRPFRSRRARSR